MQTKVFLLHITKQLLLLSITMLCISCGYKKPEGDKHPEIPVFPEHTNQKFEFVPFSYGRIHTHMMAQTNNHYYIALFSNLDFLILNKSFEEVMTLDVRGVASIHESGTFYSFTKKDYVKKAYRYQPPHFKEESIPVKKIQYYKPSFDSIVAKYSETIAEKKLNNKLFDTLKFADSIFFKKYTQDLQCVLPIGAYPGTYIFKYADRDIFVECHLYPPGKESSLFNICNTAPSIQEADDLDLFDTAVLGNSSHGNHYVFGYKSYGYEYFSLKIGNNSTKFKVHSRDRMIQLKSESKDKVIVYGDRLYWSRLKE